MDEILPVFKSHYSIGRSILTLEEAGTSVDGGPDSIIDICLEGNLKKFYLVDDGMAGFLQGYKNATEGGLSMFFGLRMVLSENIKTKNADQIKNECKCVIFCKNKAGYEKLIKIYSKASTDGFYHVPRVDFDLLHEYWNEKDLEFCVPFYDSFIYTNRLTLGNFVPNFSVIKPVFFLEDNDVPLDSILEKAIREVAGSKYEIVRTKSIYYKNRSDFPHFLTFKCIGGFGSKGGRKTLESPNFDHMCSNEFCFESWKEAVNG